MDTTRRRLASISFFLASWPWRSVRCSSRCRVGLSLRPLSVALSISAVAASPSSIALARMTSCSAARSGLAGQLLGIELVAHLDDLDVLVLQVLQDVVHLLGRDVDRGQRLDDLLVGEEAPLLALGDEVADLVDLRLLGDRHLLRYLSFGAPGGSAADPPR